MRLENTRANKQIWRVGKWLYTELHHKNFTQLTDPWERLQKYNKRFFYDKAAILLTKISNNDFTGPDNYEN